jgi:hypothetical protein
MIDLNAQGCHDADQHVGWAQDVKTVTTTVLTTTGGTLWSAAERCRQFLEAMAAELDLKTPSIRVSFRHSCMASDGCCSSVLFIFQSYAFVVGYKAARELHYGRGLCCC